VVDASILPEIPSANTNVPTLAVAEHIAARRATALGLTGDLSDAQRAIAH
jgi:choline dehydrogenase-like flavoprotein